MHGLLNTGAFYEPGRAWCKVHDSRAAIFSLFQRPGPEIASRISLPRWWPVEASLVTCVVIWGTNFVVLKAALPTMHPHVLNLFRLTSAFLILGGLHIQRERAAGRSVFSYMRVDPWRILATGILGYLLYQVAFIVGLANTTAGSAALIMASSPVWTAILAFFLGVEILGGGAWLGLILSLAGTATIVLTSHQEVDLGSTALFGNLVMVAAAILWATYTTVNRGLLGRVPPLALTFFGVCFSMLPLIVIGAPYLSDTDWSQVTPIIWVAIAFSGAFSTGLTVVLWNDAVRKIGPSRTAIFSNLVPVVALFTAVSFLGEHLEAGQVVGGLFVISGLLIVRYSGRPGKVS
jgi:drug/metabolite transporter (DMT)-like permease